MCVNSVAKPFFSIGNYTTNPVVCGETKNDKPLFQLKDAEMLDLDLDFDRDYDYDRDLDFDCDFDFDRDLDLDFDRDFDMDM